MGAIGGLVMVCKLAGLFCVFDRRKLRKDNKAFSSATGIIGMVLAFVVFGALIGTGIDSIVAMNTTAMGVTGAAAEVIDTVIPVMLGIACLVIICRMCGIFLIGNIYRRFPRD